MQTTSDALTVRWAEVAEKIGGLAEEFPAEAYDWRPVPDVRSYAEQLRHIAFWNDYLEQTLLGAKPDGDANEHPAVAYPDKPSIVGLLRRSVDAVLAALSNGSAPMTGDAPEHLAAFLQHNAEHYGQLVVYHRLRGLVPPASRGG